MDNKRGKSIDEVKTMNKNKVTTIVEMHNETLVNIKRNEIVTVENKGTCVVTKTSEDFSASITDPADIIYKLSPPKSFLYKNQKTKKLILNNYIPMNVGKARKRSRMLRFSYEYPFFDLSKIKYFGNKNEFNDRGYYAVREINNEVYNVPRVRHKSVCSVSEIESEKISFDDHLYEEYFYNDNELKKGNENPRLSYKEKLQSLIKTIKLPSFMKNFKSVRMADDEAVYDSVDNETQPAITEVKETPEAPVEEYLVPIQNNKDYCEVSYKDEDDSFITVMKKLFENIGIRKEPLHSELATREISEPIQKSFDTDRKSDLISKMADRPLPVPVENEEYFMDIDRIEANRLLEGLEDGSFLLRPSTQPNHAYTLSVSCSNAVHNVGVRRRKDGRLALGFARKGQRTFSNIPSLLRYHKKKKLLLVSGGHTLGTTVLKETPMYYQVPKNVPITIENA